MTLLNPPILVCPHRVASTAIVGYRMGMPFARVYPIILAHRQTVVLNVWAARIAHKTNRALMRSAKILVLEHVASMPSAVWSIIIPYVHACLALRVILSYAVYMKKVRISYATSLLLFINSLSSQFIEFLIHSIYMIITCFIRHSLSLFISLSMFSIINTYPACFLFYATTTSKCKCINQNDRLFGILWIRVYPHLVARIHSVASHHPTIKLYALACRIT